MCLCPELEFFYCAAVLHVTPKVLYDCVSRKKGDVPHLKRWKVLDLRVSVIPFIGPAFDTHRIAAVIGGTGCQYQGGENATRQVSVGPGSPGDGR